jgi:hypothetical protein
MAAVANVPVENEYPTRIFVPSERRERRTTWSHASIIALEVGGRGFSRDIDGFKSENGFSR